MISQFLNVIMHTEKLQLRIKDSRGTCGNEDPLSLALDFK